MIDWVKLEYQRDPSHRKNILPKFNCDTDKYKQSPMVLIYNQTRGVEFGRYCEVYGDHGEFIDAYWETIVSPLINPFQTERRLPSHWAQIDSPK